MASLVLTDSSHLTAKSFEKLPDQVMYPYAKPYDLQEHVFSSCLTSDGHNVDPYSSIPLLKMTKDDCLKVLREKVQSNMSVSALDHGTTGLEMLAYAQVVDVLRAQGKLTPHKKSFLHDVAAQFNIPEERHKSEVRRALSSQKLHTIAERLDGPGAWREWVLEGRRLIPLVERLEQRNVNTSLADWVWTKPRLRKPRSKLSTAPVPATGSTQGDQR
uniref:ENT domain-containing protein n=1 Tax=Timema douglasi TaxID=61478 RepID=A0A7R8ZGU5_TIMDO|nr:unnamed protein product [Timema douglasi]